MTNHASLQTRWAFQPANAIDPPEKPSDDVSMAVDVPTTSLVVLASAGAASDPW